MLMTVGLVGATLQFSKVEQKIKTLTQIKAEHPYFNALIDRSVSIDKIERKMKQLPGVITVLSSGVLKGDEEIKKMSSLFGKEVFPSLKNLNFQKIKVEVSKGLELKNQKLIQEYLARLVGKESVTLGTFKFPSRTRGKIFLLEMLNSWGSFLLLGVLFFFWVVSFAFLVRPVARRSFIIENFQRRKQVGPKILLGAVISIALLVTVLNITLFKSFDTTGIILLPLMGLIGMALFRILSRNIKA